MTFTTKDIAVLGGQRTDQEIMENLAWLEQKYAINAAMDMIRKEKDTNPREWAKWKYPK